jgi:hypothetical protein
MRTIVTGGAAGTDHIFLDSPQHDAYLDWNESCADKMTIIAELDVAGRQLRDLWHDAYLDWNEVALTR